MFAGLIELLKKPELNDLRTKGLYRALWDDEHISKGMLDSHLNPDEEGATCRHDFVQRSVRWIAEIAPPSRCASLLDLGCGPGIYAELFAKEGYAVTGIDYSKRSIGYAKERTALNSSGIEYLYQNYMTIDYAERFDVVTIINKDYPVLSVSDRMTLLKKIYRALKPGGMFIFDVLTPNVRKQEGLTWQYVPSSGFFSDKPHLLLEAVYQYDDADRTEIGQYVVVTDDEVKCYVTPNHYFTKAQLVSEVGSVGFGELQFFGDIAGKAYDEAGETICAVLTKQEAGKRRITVENRP